MKPILIAAALAAALLPAAGLMAQMREQPAAAPAIELDGFTLTPPQGAGWYVERGRSAVEFSRMLSIGPSRERATAEPQTFAVIVMRQRVGTRAIATPAALETFVRENMLRPDTQRQQTLVRTMSAAATVDGADCVRYEAAFEEKPRQYVLSLSGAGVVCRHPHDPSSIVHASWSERHARDAEAAPIDAPVREAQAVIESLRFTPSR